MHADIVGGYPEHELSDISFVWMLKKAGACGLLVSDTILEEVPIVPDYAGVMHDSRLGAGRLFGIRQRRIPENSIIHESVLHRIKALDYRPTNIPASYRVAQ